MRWGEAPRLEELPEPAAAARPQLVRMAATTASHLDRSIAAGGFLRHPPLPYVPGVEAAGTVLQSERFRGRRARLAARRRPRHRRGRHLARDDQRARRGASACCPRRSRCRSAPPSSRPAPRLGWRCFERRRAAGRRTGAGQRRERRGRLDRGAAARAAGARVAAAVDAAQRRCAARRGRRAHRSMKRRRAPVFDLLIDAVGGPPLAGLLARPRARRPRGAGRLHRRPHASSSTSPS